MAVRGALAHGLSLPGLRSRQGLAARGKGFHLRMRRLRQANLRHGGDDHAQLEASSDRLVLGRLSDGHPLQRNFGILAILEREPPGGFARWNGRRPVSLVYFGAGPGRGLSAKPAKPSRANRPRQVLTVRSYKSCPTAGPVLSEDEAESSSHLRQTDSNRGWKLGGPVSPSTSTITI